MSSSLSLSPLYKFPEWIIQDVNLSYIELVAIVTSIISSWKSVRKVILFCKYAKEPEKIYSIDPGLVNACSRSFRPDWGHLLENFVFLKLRRGNSVIEYYKTKAGHEVDFLITDHQGRKSLIQVSAELKDPATRKREMKALFEAMAERKLRTGTIITLDQEEKLKTDYGRIDIVPAWLWALSSQPD